MTDELLLRTVGASLHRSIGEGGVTEPKETVEDSRGTISVVLAEPGQTDQLAEPSRTDQQAEFGRTDQQAEFSRTDQQAEFSRTDRQVELSRTDQPIEGQQVARSYSRERSGRNR